MTAFDSAAAKNVSRALGLDDWPNEKNQPFALPTEAGVIWLSYEDEPRLLRLKSRLTPPLEPSPPPEWLTTLLAANAYGLGVGQAWLGLREEAVVLRADLFPAALEPDDLLKEIDSFAALVQAWRLELLEDDGRLKAPPKVSAAK